MITAVKPSENKYKAYSGDQLEELMSNYLIDSWSYSKVSTFARNEKAFEMSYLYRYPMKNGASSIAGKAYHSALDLYFKSKQKGILLDITDLEIHAFDYIEKEPADSWKLGKTTPSVDECKASAIKTTGALLKNFMEEIGVYEEEIKEILASELKLKEWVRVNGVDIPLPCNMVIDLVIKTNDGKRVIIDHKTKRSFTDEKDLQYSCGKQAITYVLGYEAATDLQVDEVWFIENKYSKNQNGSAQLKPFKIVMDDNTRRLYEALLYEPLKRMIEAVGDPDYVYLINEADSLTDKAELYSFWANTMLAEVDDFNIPEKNKPLMKERQRKIRDASLTTVTPTVIKNFKTYSQQFIPYDLSNKDMTHQEKIEHILRSFGITSKVQYTFEGYSSSSFLLEVNAGVALSAVHKHKLDIANALNVASVRVQKDLFVYDGKSYLAIESNKRSTETLYWDKAELKGLKIPLGKDNFGQTIYWDLDNHSTPHMLVCGATGSGKSVCLISIIEYAIEGEINDIFIFDPKYEFVKYRNIAGVHVLNEIEEIELQMMLLIEEMESRVKSGISQKTLVVFDEFADAVANSRKGNDLKNYGEEVIGMYKTGLPKTKRVVTSVDKSLEENLKVLLQKGRSSGFRIVAATQRASTKVITGDAKVNFPVQICFRVPKDIDSQVVIDEPGAEALNGRGDGLIKSPEYLNTIRFQAFYKE